MSTTHPKIGIVFFGLANAQLSEGLVLTEGVLFFGQSTNSPSGNAAELLIEGSRQNRCFGPLFQAMNDVLDLFRFPAIQIRSLEVLVVRYS